MKHSLLWKGLLILAVASLSVISAYPLEENVNLGLDLQGGMHLLLEVEHEKAVENTAERLAQEIKDELRAGWDY